MAEPRRDRQVGAGLALERASADKRPSRPLGVAGCRERWPADLRYRVHADRWAETWLRGWLPGWAKGRDCCARVACHTARLGYG